jgi:hypothetical protein
MWAVVIDRAEALIHEAGVSHDKAALLRHTAQEMRADALMLKVRAQEVRRARRLCGGSGQDGSALVALIVSVILERPTCLLCIAPKVGSDKLAVVRAVERLSATIRVTIANDERCRACGSSLGPIFSVGRPR